MNSSVSALPLSTLTPANEALTLRLPSSLQLKHQLPLSHALSQQVDTHRQAVRAILDGEDARLLVIVGPCSLHDPKSALEYAANLARLAHEVSDSMLLVMRAYVEKPRTTVGWKGLAYDPDLDGSDDMAGGLTLSRELMREMLQLGLPVATELLQPMAANYFDDLLSWVAIGARTTESQIHREMASGLGMPVGFKNGTDGGVGIACDAMRSAAHPHRHFGVDSQGHPAIIQTQGNPDTHLVLRGGHRGPNYDRQSVAQIHNDLNRLKIPARIMVDCSHANSGKDPSRQPEVFNDVLAQRLQGNRALIGMMIESHLFEGCQPISPSMRYGVSVTDGCLGWESTERLLRQAHRQLLSAI
ncbi:3-deoxy-7-phosphoheptulonate synthase [Pseudomonas mediterranea]|uniref:3-deoxy-7-phosphoheptulonate synthase n=1 Tax=Pseudomonas mediterranea TaxID=183795 RepID=UPI0006D8AC46|nr:3-deoxy-7-phosphoheptulonate synthase [Pseudomonas mediterranea]MBL0844193.1 3-deoxy-7-phosphoheptulonate synthase [Pseudomonas mediterranea]MDU9030275.1 3-deoxy-7-phosphoheptulonate synthase [Pseudomonas mediterranea]CAH0166468.1 Phospho-2-dehydro-3-deoxyheptonate aldolase, Tyr-sensitive [Pseudomonas mediterranea]